VRGRGLGGNEREGYRLEVNGYKRGEGGLRGNCGKEKEGEGQVKEETGERGYRLEENGYKGGDERLREGGERKRRGKE
jgi:hypothetical protein